MNADMIVYMDSSALAKRTAAGPESEIVTDLWNAAGRLVSSELAQSEARAAFEGAQGALDGLEVVRTEPHIAAAARELATRHGLEAGEATHLAAALSIDAPRVVFASWNPALAAAAAEHGMAVVPSG